ncbi:MAG: hypothetical protein Q8Q09_08585 [Deltaproteobacteria bacterium]|nr:hypothetical protein [Deltaproteobacteria bacterium]
MLVVHSRAMLGAGCRRSLRPIVARVVADTSIVVDSSVVADPGATRVALLDTVGLRSDECPEAQPREDTPCSARQYCIYPQYATAGTSCHCLLDVGGAAAGRGYQSVALRPLSVHRSRAAPAAGARPLRVDDRCVSGAAIVSGHTSAA